MRPWVVIFIVVIVIASRISWLRETWKKRR
jgi:hypothetical protein